MREKTACFTGHREIPKKDMRKIRQNTLNAIIKAYENGYRYFGSGGAIDFDLLAADCVLHLKKKYPDIRLILVLPCHGQTKYWSDKEIRKYNKIKKKADKVVFTSEQYYNGCMQKRNRHMVDNSSLCFCYLTKNTGGTAYTVNYAQRHGLKIVNVTSLNLLTNQF